MTNELNLKRDLYDRLTSRQKPLPYLFFGSGMSLRYLGLPNWEGLLTEFAVRAGLKPDYEISRVDGRLERMASNIAESFHKVWFESDEYESQRQKYPRVRGLETVLKIGVAEYLTSNSDLGRGAPGFDDPGLADEISVLREAKIDGLITTNYDRLVDEIFADFPVLVGQTGLLMGKAQFIGEIYKIHGTVDDPNSLILTESDYEQIAKQNPYLVAKLLTIFAEHPIIFAGYSIEDQYIESILIELVNAIGAEKTKEISTKFFFIEYERDAEAPPIIEDRGIVKQNTLLPMTVIRTHSYRWVWEVLASLERPIPTNFLRQVREQIYDIVRSPVKGDPRQVVHAIPYGEGGKELKFVYGFGQFSDEQIGEINQMGVAPLEGYAGNKLRVEEIFRDVLGVSEEALQPNFVLESGVPDHIEPVGNEYIPLHKYLAESGRIQNGVTDYEGLDEKVKVVAQNTPKPYPQNLKAFEKEFEGRRPSEISVGEVLETDRARQFKIDALIHILGTGPELEEFLDECRDALVVMFNSGILDTADKTSFRRALVAYSQAKWGY